LSSRLSSELSYQELYEISLRRAADFAMQFASVSRTARAEPPTFRFSGEVAVAIPTSKGNMLATRDL